MYTKAVGNVHMIISKGASPYLPPKAFITSAKGARETQSVTPLK